MASQNTPSIGTTAPTTNPASPRTQTRLPAHRPLNSTPRPNAHHQLRAQTPQQRQTTGSTTTTITSTPAEPINQPPTLVLHLRADSDTQSRRRIQWTEDTVDNEGMGKKKSKVCCIYHRTRDFGESSSEDESSSDADASDSDAGGDAGDGARRCGHGHRHKGKHDTRRRKDGEPDDNKSLPRRASPNAYEKQPHVHRRDG